MNDPPELFRVRQRRMTHEGFAQHNKVEKRPADVAREQFCVTINVVTRALYGRVHPWS
jgi:hypothetical protein